MPHAFDDRESTADANFFFKLLLAGWEWGDQGQLRGDENEAWAQLFLTG